ncbi:MAG: ABC transporter permease [Lentisphaeria bacterium]|nr:ABC transporter permease [Lentisphaeria bacterium]
MAEEKNFLTDLFTSIGGFFYAACGEVFSFIAFTGRCAYAVLDAFRHPGKIRRRELLYFMDLCGADGVPITFLICFLTGVILGYQCAVQMQKYGADAFLAGLVGCAMVRELSPLMVSIIATGRTGSAFAAEIGSMKVSEEVDALRTMGFMPERFLVIPKLFAMTLMMPLLAVIGDIAGILGGALIGMGVLNQPPAAYYAQTVAWVRPGYFFESIIKTAVFGIIITFIGCWQGFRTGSDALAVGRSTTSSVVLSILFIIIADTILAHFFNSIFF